MKSAESIKAKCDMCGLMFPLSQLTLLETEIKVFDEKTELFNGLVCHKCEKDHYYIF
ncbi:hypothetical protein [Brevibacillus sp. SYSU BS000544]|uniref:hypothetical protein n=1 Tax=Brevibacillus sp. SYSU BS000544 TaxID=3416443 RepID=UPI003CE458AD